MPVTLKAMQYFTTALRAGNIARASEELNVAASAIGAAIDQIEDHFGLKLVARARARGITPTAFGRVMARRFEDLLGDYDALLREGVEIGRGRGGDLRIGYYAPVAPAFLPDILRACLPDGHSITLHLEECDNNAAQAGLMEGRFDLILFVASDIRPGLEHDPLIEAPVYALLPEGHPLAQHSALSLSQIAREPLIVLDRPVAGPYYQHLFKGQGADPQIAAYANSTEMVRALVGAGRGVALLNMRPRTQTSYAGDRLVVRAITDPLPPLTLSVGYAKSGPRRVVTEFVAAARAFFADPAQDHGVLSSDPQG